jgi:uncharacterized protein YyaL (SSP411 family)
VKNLEWALSQQGEDGWFCCAAFEPKDDPLTHTLGYTIEGLLEAGKMLDEPRWIEAARLAADAMRGWQSREGWLRGTYGPGWRPGAKWSCLTGEAQMALVWMQFYGLTGDGEYLAAANRAILRVKKAQPRTARMAEARGGVSGSSPIYGEYGCG